MGPKTNPLPALAFGLLALFGPATASAACRDMVHDASSYTICEVGVAEDLRLFHSGPDGKPWSSFQPILDALELQGQSLGFAMNAGMYHRNLAPVGLYIENGVQTAPIVTREGPGNFGLLPNGVFCIGERLSVIESRTFAAAPPACRHASQSGPMLVINGDLHPRFLADSDSSYIRNGVGTSADGRRAVFAISNEPVTFHQFARLFRDGLGLPDALYFDGSVSRLLAADLGRHDGGFPIGPMVGVVIPKP